MKVTKYSSSTCIKCRILTNDWDKIKELKPNWEYEEILIDNDSNAVQELLDNKMQAFPVIRFDNGKDKIYTSEITSLKDYEDFITVPF